MSTQRPAANPTPLAHLGATPFDPEDFRQLFDSHPEAVLLWDPRADRILEANARACALLKRERATLIDSPPSALHAGERGALVVFTQAVLEKGEAWTNSLAWRLADGTCREVEYMARRVALASRELLLICARDREALRRRDARNSEAYRGRGLTNWRRVEQMFSVIESENRLILRAAGEGIYGVDANGAATFINPAAERMLGWSARELVGSAMHEIIHHSNQDGEAYPVAECPIYAAFNEGEVQRRDDEVFWRKDGSAFPVEYTSTPILDHGRIIGAVVVFRDISERRETEARLFQTMTELERLKLRLELENDYLQEAFSEDTNYREIVGRSKALRDVVRKIERVAPTYAPVLITGESGTGKELIARAIHAASQRGERPLIRVNCAAVPAELFESEFFGHIKGAFTGAVSDRVGRFELAHGGTLFLDEVGEIPLPLQGKLLRVLQEGQFERVGDNRTRTVSVRVVAATNRDLEREIAAGRFRQDLFYRLNVFPIESVPLRKRPEDIPLLAMHFLSESIRRQGRDNLHFTAGSIERMKAYRWPGNVRELENVIERAVILSIGGKVDIGLPTDPLSAEVPAEAPVASETPSPPGIPKNEAELKQQELAMILAALEATDWVIFGAQGAAARIGLKPTTLTSRIKRLGLSRPRTT
jgi:PAS domain S-box-containing protein